MLSLQMPLHIKQSEKSTMLTPCCLVKERNMFYNICLTFADG